MKVTSVTCHLLQSKVDKPFVSARGWLYATRSSCLVEIATDEGITGWGECYGPAAVDKALHRDAVRAARHRPRPVRRRGDLGGPLQPDQGLRREGHGDHGALAASTSRCGTSWAAPVDKPIHKLIGGAYRSEVMAYATGLYFIDMDRLVEEAVEEALGYVEQGFRAIKMKIGLGDPKLDIRRVEAVREAIGPTVKLAVDANHCFTVPQAIQLGRDDGGARHLMWFEEPISPEDHRRLCRGDARARHGGGRRRERLHPLGLPRHHREEGDGHRAARRLRRRRHQRMPQDRDAGLGAWRRMRAARLGLARSASPRRCSSSRRCRTSRRPSGRCRRCWNSSRRQTRCATTSRRSRSAQVKGIVKVPTGPGLGIEVDREVLARWKVA